MKIGETFTVTPTRLLDPLIGQLVVVTVNGKDVKARILEVNPAGLTTLKVVPDQTKE